MPLAVKIVSSVFLGFSIVGVLMKIIFNKAPRDELDAGICLWQIAWRVVLIVLAWVF